MELTPAAISLLKQRYCTNGESPSDIFPRVANAISLAWNVDKTL